MCRVVKASTLHEDAIRVRTSPPSATHVRAYMAVEMEEPSGTQPLPSNGEEEPHLSPSNHHLVGRTPQHLQANLGDLTDNELQQLMEELHREIALQELNAPPRNPPQTPWGNPMGNGDPDADDWEVIFLRGEGGFPQSNHFDLLPLHNQMEGGSPEDSLLICQHLFNLMRM